MRHLCTVLLMCCAMSVLCFSLQPLYAQEKKRVNRKEVEERASGGDFYRVIIENNLFRPLGWQRPNRDPEYALVATWIGTRGTVAKALVMERKSSELYYVAQGEKVGDAIVENIAANQVSLKASDDIVTLKAEAMQFLSGSSRSGDKSGEGGDSEASAEGPERRDQRAGRRGANQERDALREWLRTASPEERRRKLEAIRRQRGGGGGRGGGGRRGGGDDGGDKKEDEENWEEIKGK